MRAPILLGLGLLLTACDGAPERPGRMPSGAAGDGGVRVDLGTGPGDGGPPDLGLAPPSDGVAIAVEASGFLPRGTGAAVLGVALRIANGASASPLPLSSPVAVETEGGLAVQGRPVLSGNEACPAEASLLPGAERSCAYTFALPPGDRPARIRLTGPAGAADAALPGCGASAPRGWCAPPSDGCPEEVCPIEQCVDGSCAAPCSASAPSGYCVEPGETCRSGQCRPDCGPGAPSGWCPSGERCVDGACEASTCDRLRSPLPGECLGCVAQVCPEGCVSPTCEACFDCVVGAPDGDWCGCVDQPACSGGCGFELTALMANLLGRCGLCFEP